MKLSRRKFIAGAALLLTAPLWRRLPAGSPIPTGAALDFARCPGCGSTDTLRYVYGLIAELEPGEILGGCCESTADPKYACGQCWADWGPDYPPRCNAWNPLADCDVWSEAFANRAALVAGGMRLIGDDLDGLRGRNALLVDDDGPTKT